MAVLNAKAQSQTSQPSPDGSEAGRRVDVLICGGGISGLSLATWLGREGVEAHVIDKGAATGGVIATLRKDGFLFERGPNTILDKYPSLSRLIELAGLEEEVLRCPLKSQKRHIWFRGRLHEAPMGLLPFLLTPLLPLSGKLALLREPFVKARMDDESVADFVARRLGQSWARNLITPMVSGIWAGDPAKLSIAHAFPIMKKMEREGGSLLAGAVRHFRELRRKRRQAARDGEQPRRRGKSLVSFRDGLQRLPEALAAHIGERYHGSTRVERIEPLGDEGGFRVETSSRDIHDVWIARRLVVAAEADQAAGWLEAFDSEAAAVLRGFPYNKLVAVGLGLDANEARLPEGFGFLVPRGEGVRLLGAIIHSNFLPDRAPEGCAALAIFIGGDLDPAAADLGDDEIAGLVRRDLRKVLSWEGEIRSIHIERWPRAIPQYDLRQGERLRQLEAAKRRHPGLHLVGNWRGGVSIPDRVELSWQMSREMKDLLLQSRAEVQT